MDHEYQYGNLFYLISIVYHKCLTNRDTCLNGHSFGPTFVFGLYRLNKKKISYLGIFIFLIFIQASDLDTVFELFWLLGTRTILESRPTELPCAAPVSVWVIGHAFSLSDYTDSLPVDYTGSRVWRASHSLRVKDLFCRFRITYRWIVAASEE